MGDCKSLTAPKNPLFIPFPILSPLTRRQMQSIKAMELFKKDNGFGRNGQSFLTCNFMDVSLKELQQLFFFYAWLNERPL